MKRLIASLSLILTLFTLCALPAFAEETPMPSFEERKEMAIEAATNELQLFADDLEIEWDHNMDTLSAEAYPSYGVLGMLPEYHITAEEAAETSSTILLLFYSDGKPLTRALTHYIPESNTTVISLLGGSENSVQTIADQIEIFNQIKTEDSPICIANSMSQFFVYGDTVYGDNMLMPVNFYPEEKLDYPYFQSMDTDGYPLIMVEDFEFIMKELEKHPEWIGGIPLYLLPKYPHSVVVRNRWIFGTAGVLLLIWFGFASYRVYRAKRQAKAE